MITVNRIKTKSDSTGLAGMRVKSPATEGDDTSWGAVVTAIEQAVQRITQELTASGRLEILPPHRESLGSPVGRLLVRYADQLYVLPFYGRETTPAEPLAELRKRDRPVDPARPYKRYITRVPTLGLWYALPNKLKKMPAATEIQLLLLTQLRTAILGQSLQSQHPTARISLAVTMATAALEMIAALSAIKDAPLESPERHATEAFLKHMAGHFTALQTACTRALDEQTPTTVHAYAKSVAWAYQITNWERRTPRKEKIL